MVDLHEASFIWPDTNPQDVIITGSFDQWSASIHLSKSVAGFVGKVKVPWGARVYYKFIVDGKWMTLRSQPEEFDTLGNLNNVYDSPSQPEISQGEATTNHIAPSTHDTPIFDNNNAPVIIGDSNSSENKPDIPPTESAVLPEIIFHPPESIALPSSAPFEVSPPTDPYSNAIEPVISPGPVQQTPLPVPVQLLPVVPPTPIIPLENESTPTEPTSNKGSNPVEFPKSEEKPASNESATESKPTPLVKPAIKENAPSTASVESESRPSSVVLTSAPSSPVSHFRSASQPRSRNVSSKSDSIRSDAKRSKRTSIFGKVKHLFHLDKDS